MGVLKGFTREDPFENGEKDLNQVVEGLALSLNFKFKCLFVNRIDELLA